MFTLLLSSPLPVNCVCAAAVDVNGQQIDLRRENSWVLRAHEIHTPEVAEVFAINSIAPFVLISRLKGTMGGWQGCLLLALLELKKRF